MEKNHDDTYWTRDDLKKSNRHLALDAYPSCNLETPTSCRKAPVATNLKNIRNCTLGEKAQKSDRLQTKKSAGRRNRYLSINSSSLFMSLVFILSLNAIGTRQTPFSPDILLIRYLSSSKKNNKYGHFV